MPFQSVTEENRVIGRPIRNVRHFVGRISLRAIRHRPHAAVSSFLPVAADIPFVRLLESEA